MRSYGLGLGSDQRPDAEHVEDALRAGGQGRGAAVGGGRGSADRASVEDRDAQVRPQRPAERARERKTGKLAPEITTS